MEEELPDGDADGELNGDQLLMAVRVAAARPGGAIRMGEVIERIKYARQPRAAKLPTHSDASATTTATRQTEWTERSLAAIPTSCGLIRCRRA